jgi:hypothetical protein
MFFLDFWRSDFRRSDPFPFQLPISYIIFCELLKFFEKYVVINR